MPAGPNGQQGYGFVFNGAPGGDGSVTPLGGSTAPTDYPAIRNSQPFLISDSGQILGANQPASGVDPGSYYVYSNGQVTALSMAPAGFNNAGQVIGMSFQVAPNGTVSPVVYNLSTGTQQNILSMPGASQTWAVAINGSGQIAGNTFYPNSANPASPAQGGAFFYSNGTMTNIGTLGGASSTVVAINSSGDVIGTSSLSSNLIAHAFLYVDGKMTDLGSLPGYQESSASGINAQGQVVGSVGNPGLTPAGVSRPVSCTAMA
jgi:probable HAF family extracellular repeat protein